MTSSVEILFSEKSRTYFGPELRPHFLLTEMGLKGSALAAFIGPCQVKTEHLVDWEDRMVSDRIEANSMVHFLGEFFGIPLREGVFLQRLTVSIAKDLLARELGPRALELDLRREGDDLFLQNRKLSVSIVTASPVSVLFHLGINIDPSGAPVPAIGLQELGIDASKWGRAVLEAVQKELDGIGWACVKVRPVI
jgi:hypothetical protein